MSRERGEPDETPVSVSLLAASQVDLNAVMKTAW
jgi:hypothetical protein